MSLRCGNGQTEAMSSSPQAHGVPPFPMFVGCGRSGTTLVRAIFDSHSQFAVSHHAQFIVDMAKRRRRYEDLHGLRTGPFLTDLFASHRFPLLQVPEDEIRRELASPTPSYPDAVRRVLALYARRQAKARFGDKTPGHVVHITLLATLFPEACFVHVVRDGRSSWLGYRDRGFGPQSLPDAALNWRSRVLRGRRAGLALGPTRYREVRYEDLVEQPETVIGDLCPFLGLEYEDDMLRYHERAEAVLAGMGDAGREAFENVARPLTQGLRDWRTELSADDLALFDVLAGDVLAELGYERAGDGARRAPVVARHWLDWQRRRATVRVEGAARRVRGRPHGGADADWGHSQPKSRPSNSASRSLG